MNRPRLILKFIIPCVGLTCLFASLPCAATTYATCKTQVFTTAQQANPAISGENAIPSNDGIANLQKYALGMNPWQLVSTGLPTFSQVTQGSQNFMALTFSSPAIDPPSDLVYAVQASSDMQTWQQGPGLTSLYATQGPIGGLMFTTWMANGLPITVPTGNPANLFIRLRLSETAIISLASGIYSSGATAHHHRSVWSHVLLHPQWQHAHVDHGHSLHHAVDGQPNRNAQSAGVLGGQSLWRGRNGLLRVFRRFHLEWGRQ